MDIDIDVFWIKLQEQKIFWGRLKPYQIPVCFIDGVIEKGVPDISLIDKKKLLLFCFYAGLREADLDAYLQQACVPGNSYEVFLHVISVQLPDPVYKVSGREI